MKEGEGKADEKEGDTMNEDSNEREEENGDEEEEEEDASDELGGDIALNCGSKQIVSVRSIVAAVLILNGSVDPALDFLFFFSRNKTKRSLCFVLKWCSRLVFPVLRL